MEANSAGVTKPRTSSGVATRPSVANVLSCAQGFDVGVPPLDRCLGILTGGRVCHRPWPLAHVGVEKVHPRGPRPRLFVEGALVDHCLNLLTALIRFRLKVLVNLPGPYQFAEYRVATCPQEVPPLVFQLHLGVAAIYPLLSHGGRRFRVGGLACPK